MKNSKQKFIVGWREWVALPALHTSKIKAKLDTGARTSALHAINIATMVKDNVLMASFEIYPLQRNSQKIKCEAKVLGIKKIRSSNGMIEQRYTIETELMINNISTSIAVTLTNREQMGFRLLLGRTALRGHILLDPARSYLLGK